MKDDQGKRASDILWTADTLVTDSTILDAGFVTESLERNKFDSTVLDPSRGIINGLLLGACGWAIALLAAFVLFG